MELARRILTRLDLSQAQLITLRTLYRAHPEWVSRDDLCEATGYSPHQIAGLMGAFGRRASHTESYIDGTKLFDFQWDDELGIWEYRLPDSMVEAMRLEELV